MNGGKVRLLGLTTYMPDVAFLSIDEFIKKYTSNNNGNLVYTYALAQILDIGPMSIRWRRFSKEQYPEVEILILPLANQLGSHIDLSDIAEAFKKIDIPIVAVGLGYQCSFDGIEPKDIPQGTWNWFDEITKHAQGNNPNISLRGQGTYDLISKRNKEKHCIVTGCPSNFINPSTNLGFEISKKEIPDNPRFAVAAGNPYHVDFKPIEQSLVKMVNESDGLYICQNPEVFMKLSRQEIDSIPKKEYIAAKSYLSPSSTKEEFERWFKNKSHVFFDVPEWLETIKRFDIVVGARIHGTLIGIQAGIPSLCICTDSRTLELCQIMHIPHINARNYLNGITKEEIIKIIRDWDWQKYDETRKHLASILLDFFEKNNVPVANYFREIATS